MNPSKSFERIVFSALISLTLAPIFLQSLWPFFAWILKIKVDSFFISLSSLLVTMGALFSLNLFNKHVHLRCFLSASSVGVGIAILLGNNVQATLIIASALISLALFVSTLMIWAVSHLPIDFNGLAKKHKVKACIFILVSVLTVVQTTRLSTFMGDAKRVEFSILPRLCLIV
ncbi:MAG: hypothetical protein EXS67_04250 [Candidatus Margulisbacteria bacterium]|nr:hypothetical protein [Candidatus Margulisiibacteriota bacterium]